MLYSLPLSLLVRPVVNCSWVHLMPSCCSICRAGSKTSGIVGCTTPVRGSSPASKSFTPTEAYGG